MWSKLKKNQRCVATGGGRTRFTKEESYGSDFGLEVMSSCSKFEEEEVESRAGRGREAGRTTVEGTTP